MSWRGAMVAAVVGWSEVAWATGYYIEASPSREKAAPQAWVETATAAGHEARVVRRFRAGGWEYVFRVDGLSDAAAAGQVATALATRLVQTLTVYRIDGDQAVLVTTHPPTMDPTAPVDDGDATVAADPEVAAILARAVAAHGGEQGGLAAIAASTSLLFEYRRVVPNGPTVFHTYSARAADISLRTKISEGEGVASRTWMGTAGAWLAVGDAPAVAQDKARTKEVLARFAPESVLAFPLGFASAAAQRSEFKRLKVDGDTRVHDRPCDVLRYRGDRSSPAFVLAIDKEEGFVRRVTFVTDAGEITHEFQDWKTVAPGLVIPRKVDTWRATARIDEVHIERLDVSARLPDDWFAAP